MCVLMKIPHAFCTQPEKEPAHYRKLGKKLAGFAGFYFACLQLDPFIIPFFHLAL